MKIFGKCLRNDEGLSKGARGSVIVWHGGTNWDSVLLRVRLRKHEPMDVMYDL